MYMFWKCTTLEFVYLKMGMIQQRDLKKFIPKEQNLCKVRVWAAQHKRKMLTYFR